MSALTEKMIKKIMPYAPSAKIRALLPIMTAVAVHYQITSARRLRFWLSTLAIESGELKYTSELGVHPEYEGRKDLGNTQKGDGIKFEGHGNIQITGRDAHTKYRDYVKKSGHLPYVDFVKSPEKLAEQPYALDSAGWFVNGYKNLNPLADDNNFLAYQIKVNGRNRKTGKPNHWAERCEYLRRATTVIPDGFVLTPTAEGLVLDKIEKARVEDVKNYPDFDIPATPLMPNTDNPNGEDDIENLDTSVLTASTSENDVSGASQAENGSNTLKTPNTATSDTEKELICKEKPSTFMKWLTAAKTAIGGLIASIGAWFGFDDIKTVLMEKAGHLDGEAITLIGLLVLKLLVIIGIGAFLVWIASKIYDKSAERANRLNIAKINAAEDKTKTTVDFKN